MISSSFTWLHSLPFRLEELVDGHAALISFFLVLGCRKEDESLL